MWFKYTRNLFTYVEMQGGSHKDALKRCQFDVKILVPSCTQNAESYSTTSTHGDTCRFSCRLHSCESNFSRADYSGLLKNLLEFLGRVFTRNDAAAEFSVFSNQPRNFRTSQVSPRILGAQDFGSQGFGSLFPYHTNQQWVAACCCPPFWKNWMTWIGVVFFSFY